MMRRFNCRQVDISDIFLGAHGYLRYLPLFFLPLRLSCIKGFPGPIFSYFIAFLTMSNTLRIAIAVLDYDPVF